MNMDNLTRNGELQTWLAPGVYSYERTLLKVDSFTKTILLDAPMPMHIDASLYDSPSIIFMSFLVCCILIILRFASCCKESKR